MCSSPPVLNPSSIHPNGRMARVAAFRASTLVPSAWAFAVALTSPRCLWPNQLR